MSVDLDLVEFSSSYNSFKNNDILTSGQIVFPTVVTASAVGMATVTLTLSTSPVFSEFLSYFTEFLDLGDYVSPNYGNPKWHPGIIASSGGVGLWVTAPAIHAGLTYGLINVIINGTTMTVEARVPNPYSVDITLAPLTVPFALTSYTLAN
jgi:hypothetical protein